MPHLTLNGARLYYEDTGTGPETILFAHGLLWSGRLFDRLVAALQEHFRCITFDFRGQGQSQVTASGYDMDHCTGQNLLTE
jgi:3-oxoadipate enol-lactonase